MKLPLKEVVFDEGIYPRNQKSNKTIESYTESILIGAKFPPIEVQRVSNYKNKEAWILTDGCHRLEAYKEANRSDNFRVEDIEVVEWQKDVILDYKNDFAKLLLRGVALNLEHGDRLKNADKQSKVILLAELDIDQKYTEQFFADTFGVTQQTINNWISHIRAKQKAGRDNKIHKLSRLGWTQDEIGEQLGISRNRISEIVDNTKFGIIDNFFKEGKSIDWICDHFSIDSTLFWAILLDGKTDKERFGGSKKPPNDSLKWGLRVYDNWFFTECDKRFGDDWPGRIPGQLVAHALYFFTKEGDLVFDPMAGGGVVPDICLVFNRKCRAYDLNIRDERPEIQKHHWRLGDMKWPKLKKKPNLIFFDPPYFSKMAKEYEEKEQGGDKSISSLSRSDYMQFFREFLLLAKENLADNGRLMFLNSDWRDYEGVSALEENATNAITSIDYGNLLIECGWQITHIVNCDLSSEQINPSTVNRYQDDRRLAVLRRYLLVAK